MPKFIRFVYAATSTATPAKMREHLLDIEKIGSNLNAVLHMRGVLLYGNGYFLHYIEGIEEQVNKVYDVSMQSIYTKEFKLLRREPIHRIHFKAWNIKYFLKEEVLKKFYHRHALGQFNPYRLSGTMLDELLYILRQQDEPITRTFVEQYQYLLHEVHNNEPSRQIPFNYMFLGLLLVIVIGLAAFSLWHFNIMGMYLH